MFPGLPLAKSVHAGMIVLALMASLPEVVCCCDVSWGPGGLLGGKSLCQQRCTAAKSCCHEHARHEGPSEEECGSRDSDCDCTFSIVNPSPICVARNVDVEQAQ